ncbi:hypothetical protein PWT90_03445 [Aphanocladium album]|nr:hypothetical protein PWT90_03445 [Aphanocladium album]
MRRPADTMDSACPCQLMIVLSLFIPSERTALVVLHRKIPARVRQCSTLAGGLGCDPDERDPATWDADQAPASRLQITHDLVRRYPLRQPATFGRFYSRGNGVAAAGPARASYGAFAN